MAADNNKELLRVIDKNGKWTKEYLTRKEASTLPGIYFNTVFCWFYNSSNKTVLFEKRSLNKKYNPGRYGLVGGHVVEDESVEKALENEVHEEIGLDIKTYNPIFIGVCKPKGLYRSFAYQYLIIVDKEIKNIKFQKEEVDFIVWLKYDEVKKMVLNNSQSFAITPDRFKAIFNKIDKIIKSNNL